MEPHCISEMLAAAERFPNKLIVSKRSYVFEKNTSAGVMHYYNHEVQVLPVKDAGSITEFSPGEIGHLFAAQPGLNFIGEPSLYFFSRSLFEQAGIFDDQLLQVCDLDFALRCADHSGLVYIDKKLSHFTVHASSTTSKNVSVHYFRLRFFEIPVLINKLKMLHGKLFDTLGLKGKLRLYFYTRLRAFEADFAIGNNASFKALYQDLLGKYPFMEIKGWERVFLFPLHLLARKRIKQEGIKK